VSLSLPVSKYGQRCGEAIEQRVVILASREYTLASLPLKLRCSVIMTLVAFNRVAEKVEQHGYQLHVLNGR